MKQKCLVCNAVLEPQKEDEIRCIEIIKRNKLNPSVLSTMLAPTLGDCTDGGRHECVFDDDDRHRMVTIISKYDENVANIDANRKAINELSVKESEILCQLSEVRKQIHEGVGKQKLLELENNGIAFDYEKIANTSDIDFYRLKEDKKEDKK